jgi:hypothetical protein
MKHVHTFTCPVFALQNALASGKLLLRWPPHARLGLNLGPSPTHARNVYLVLNLMTGCVSPQHHCWFDDFFETPHHGGPDVSNTISQQQLAGLSHAAQIFLILHVLCSLVRCHELFFCKTGLMIWMISPCPKWILTS